MVSKILAISILFLGGLVVSLGLCALVLARLPEDYFVRPSPRTRMGILAVVAKNLAGAAIVIVGLLLSIPGVPGQGLLTIFAGIVLLDFPGKYRLERRIVSRPAVLAVVNRFRRFVRKPPMQPPEQPERDAPDAGSK